ncbi:hypothetical protein [Mangrovimonas sp. DI 80]|uniref:hypothetical protein n=1 Tax=Mangrovimonas sp. DI 80 TaxID=1779330 RepID=UPI000976430D|nr:hypothetical protein [Mangrovimonas sp. DI 80]OMP30074.1 hypothetical protein BKM32_14445 [Mangrovimonas sp. DI 80]
MTNLITKNYNGFIMLWRSITEWEWYTDVNVFKVFVHCLLKVNYSSKRWQGILINKGEFITSYEKLAVETGLSISKVRTALKKLKGTGTIEVESSSYTKIRIINFNDFIAEVEGGNDISNSIQNSMENDRGLASDSHSFRKQLATTNTKDNLIINRKKRFREEVYALYQFKNETLSAFYNYWSELNDDKSKMRFEEQRFFEIEKRLNKWVANEKKSPKKVKSNLITNR